MHVHILYTLFLPPTHTQLRPFPAVSTALALAHKLTQSQTLTATHTSRTPVGLLGSLQDTFES